ncbi:hypothetical protein [Desulfosporosinus acididurans]|uniref:hypothetical protein n=1 Tax=Desulfosporosinus acididurans TaxID=476652 RepID=UPI00137934D6|nr:hypothetical protein [Desulfosporosinus acididurans]
MRAFLWANEHLIDLLPMRKPLIEEARICAGSSKITDTEQLVLKGYMEASGMAGLEIYNKVAKTVEI